MSERLVERTWLELGADPAVAPSPPPDGVRLARCVPCSPARYLELYRAVGAPWNWVDRLGWPADRLAAHLADPDVLVFEATGDGTLAGYFELQRHPDRSVELAYFGLVPEALGRGIGRWLLQAAIAEAWRLGPTRLWLHTCTDDHPAALPNYLRRGFRVTRVEQVAAARHD